MHRYTLKILGKLSKSVTFNATLNTHLKDKLQIYSDWKNKIASAFWIG